MIHRSFPLYFDETEPSDTTSEGSDNGIDIDTQYLYDREYNGENERLDNSDIELFSEDAVTAESEYIRLRDESCLEDRAAYFSIIPEEKSVSDHIYEDLQGGALFGKDSFGNNTSTNTQTVINPNLIIVFLCIVGVVVGCGGAMLFRKIKARRG